MPWYVRLYFHHLRLSSWAAASLSTLAWFLCAVLLQMSIKWHVLRGTVIACLKLEQSRVLADKICGKKAKKSTIQRNSLTFKILLHFYYYFYLLYYSNSSCLCCVALKVTVVSAVIALTAVIISENFKTAIHQTIWCLHYQHRINNNFLKLTDIAFEQQFKSILVWTFCLPIGSYLDGN